MPSRIRYLSSSPISRRSLRSASDGLCDKEYSGKEAWGFIDIRNEGDALTGTFVERFETEDEVIDPFGNATTYRRIQFNQTTFRLGSVAPQLELYDAPRSVAPLLTELSNCFEGNLSFASVHIDLRRFVKILKKESASLTLLAATLQDVTLAADILARVAVVGSAEITPYLKMAAFGRDVVLDKICLTGTNPSGSFKTEITSDGRIQIISGYSEELMETLRGVVEKCIGSSS